MLRYLILDKDSVRVIDFLLKIPDEPFSKAEIHRATRVSFKKMDRALGPIIKCKMIKPSKKIGRAQLYRLDENNRIFRMLDKLDLSVCKILLDNEHTLSTVQGPESREPVQA